MLKFVEIVFVGTAFVEIVFVGTVFIGLLVGIVFDGAVSVGTVFVNFISHNYWIASDTLQIFTINKYIH